MRALEHLVDLVRSALARAVGPGTTPATPARLVAARRAPGSGLGSGLRPGLVQPDRTTCGPACLVVARSLGDPDYARWLESGEVAGRARDPRPRRRRFADEVLTTHRRTNRWRGASGARQVGWPRTLGTTPWSLARELTATGGTAAPGTRHRVRTVAPRRRGEAYDEVLQAVRIGHAVPLYVGTRLLPRHVVLVVGGDHEALTAYDPASGTAAALTRDAFARGALRVAGWSEPWFAVVPAGRTAH